MLGGTQERRVREGRTPAEVAKGNLRAQLAKHVKTCDLHKLDTVLRQTEGHMTENLGGLQKKAVWDKLAHVTTVCPELGAAVLDGRVSPEQLFRKSTEELVDLLLDQKPNDRDPDV